MIDVFFNRKYCELYEVADIEVCNEFVFNSEYGTVKTTWHGKAIALSIISYPNL